MCPWVKWRISHPIPFRHILLQIIAPFLKCVLVVGPHLKNIKRIRGDIAQMLIVNVIKQQTYILWVCANLKATDTFEHRNKLVQMGIFRVITYVTNIFSRFVVIFPFYQRQRTRRSSRRTSLRTLSPRQVSCWNACVYCCWHFVCANPPHTLTCSPSSIWI